MAKKVPLRITEIKAKNEHTFIGSIGDEIIGKAALYIDKDEAEFRIHLVPEWQGRGFGTKLTKYAVSEGLKYLDRIWLGFDEGNEAARKIYEKVGFKYFLHRMEIRCIEQE